MLLEQASDAAVCNARAWDPRQLRSLRWPSLFRAFELAFRRCRASERQTASPELRLAKMVMAIESNPHADESDRPMLLEEIEAQIAASADIAAGQVLAEYLSDV